MFKFAVSVCGNVEADDGVADAVVFVDGDGSCDGGGVNVESTVTITVDIEVNDTGGCVTLSAVVMSVRRSTPASANGTEDCA